MLVSDCEGLAAALSGPWWRWTGIAAISPRLRESGQPSARLAGYRVSLAELLRPLGPHPELPAACRRSRRAMLSNPGPAWDRHHTARGPQQDRCALSHLRAQDRGWWCGPTPAGIAVAAGNQGDATPP